MAHVLKEYGADTVRRIERNTYLMLMGSSVGSASLISFFIISYRLMQKSEKQDIAITAILLIVTGFWRVINHQKHNKLNGNIDILASEMKSSNRPSSDESSSDI